MSDSAEDERQRVKVLLKKDWLILRRSWFFLIMFTLVPILMMTGFWYLKSCIEPVFQDEKNNLEHSRYGTINNNLLPFQGSNMDKRIQRTKYFQSNVTAMGSCKFGRRKDIGIIAPKNFTQGYESVLKAELSKWQRMDVYLFNTADELFEDIATNKSHLYCFAFEVSMITPKAPEVNVTIYFPRDDMAGLINTYTPLYDLTLKNPDWLSWNKTFLLGTPHFMLQMTDMLIWLMRGRRMKTMELAFIPMKSSAFQELPPSAAAQLTQTFPIFFICVYLLPLYYLVTRLADEKESKAREGMKMMGLRDHTYYKSFFIFNLCLQVYTSLLLVGVVQIEIFAESNAHLILLMCVIYGTQMFGFAFSLVALLPSQKASATAASILHLATYYVTFIYQGYGTSMLKKAVISCLVPNCALGFMLDHLLHCEIEGGIGLNLETAFMPYQSYNFMLGLACQVCCSLLWALIGIYLDKIMPKDFGRSEPWNFLCKSKTKLNSSQVAEAESQNPDLVSKGNFEGDAEYLKRGESLKIRQLRKKYANGFTAVQNQSMTMYKGQIFALLGHNGAGKTTTINMLTGLIEPSEGQAIVGNIDIFNDMETLRANLGVCPQHNVLFDALTVREHLELFLNLKGPKKTQFEINKRVDRMIAQVELQNEQFQLAATLSGGQKRKLSVGIALIGDAKIVMLDEPTSGMDTTTRRRFWEMIKQFKQDRIIILTTHYMDEADVLGDRICIMAEGQVQCCGSSLFLKKRFGVGYSLTLNKVSNEETSSSQVQTYVKSKLSEAKFVQDLHTELIYQLPESARSSFKQFFDCLDCDLQSLNLTSYGVSITTLEEVFLKIGHGEADDGNTLEQIKQKTADVSKLTAREVELTEYSISKDNHKSFWSEIRILIKKKLLVQVRDLRSCVMDIVLPCLMIVGGIYISQMEIVPDGHPARNMSLYEYPRGAPLVTNFDSYYQSNEDMEEFTDYAFTADVGEGKLYSSNKTMELDTEVHFFEQIREMDNHLYETRNQSGPYFAEFFVSEANKEDRRYSIASLVNASQPTAALSATTYMLQSIMRNELENFDFRLNFFEAQLPFSMEWQVYVNTALGLLSSLGFAIAFMMISDTLIQSLIKEKQLAIKHQILISGGSKLSYWVSHYIIDVITHSIPAIFTCLALSYFNIAAPSVEVLFFWFVLTNPVFIYACQYFFKNDGQASVFIRVFYFALGGVAPIAMQVLRVFNHETIAIADYLQWYFRYVPIYNINIGYISIINMWIIEALLKWPKGSMKPLDWKCAGEPLWFIQSALFLCLLFVTLIENNLITIGLRPMLKPIQNHLEMIHLSVQPKKNRRVYSIDQIAQMEDDSLELTSTCAHQNFQVKIFDDDPNQESERVKSLNQSALKVENLTKAYTPFSKAVDNISFALDYGECFALLGITGAGKTTTFKCLCQEEIPDEGTLYMAGHDLRTQFGFQSARQMIGYCPQFDAIYEHLTVKEHLEFYAVIKGVKLELRVELVQRQIRELDLVKYTNVHAGKLSGGNKRKLSCAIALIGNPPIVLLDEPSTGVDPQAKRFMWTVISNISTLRKQSTVILTTHSMEEAEALCPKMGIMVDGKFQCFGSAQHIKDKYADGFDIDLKIKDLDTEEVVQILDKLPQQDETGFQFSDFKHDSQVYEREVQNILQGLQMQRVWESQVKDKQSLKEILRSDSPFLLSEVIRWAHLEYKGMCLVDKLTEIFGQCQIIEHFTNRYNLKVSRNNQSIGFVFGVLEELQEPFQISGYSATQTTLEQIFNMFALQKGVKDRHESVELMVQAQQASLAHKEDIEIKR